MVLLPFAPFAQTAVLTGVVVDAESGQPVPFAVVEMRAYHVGAQATAQGVFALELPVGLAASDSLRVTALSFATQLRAVPKESPCRLALRPLAVALPEAVVRPSTATPVTLGPTADGSKFGFGGGAVLSAERSSGWQVARKFTNGPSGTVRSVKFYLKPNPHCGKSTVKAPFRVRIYAADGPNGAPGTDLLKASVLTAGTKTGWHEVDLAAHNLQAPASGFFVAMEWLFTTPEFGCDYTYLTPAKEKKAGHSYGQYLGGYLIFNEPASWYLSAGYPWQRFQPLPQFADKGNQSAAIQAVIQPD